MLLQPQINLLKSFIPQYQRIEVKYIITSWIRATLSMIRRLSHLRYYFCQQKNPKSNQNSLTNFISKIKISEEHRKILQICKPEYKKYFSNGIITLLHAGLFMYVPNIYGDINYLMELKISNMEQAAILSEYGMILGKWSVVFGLMGIFTYWRRFDFLDISNRIGIRMRTVAFRKIMESQFYRTNLQYQTYVHHLITDIQTVSWFTGETIFMGLRGFFFLMGGTACLLFQSPYICIIAGVTMTGFNLFYRPRNQKLKQLKEAENTKLIQLSEHIAERFHNIRLIKICHTEVLEDLKLTKKLSQFYEYARKVAKANGFNYASLEALGFFSLFSIAACGSLLISFELSNFSLITSSTYALYVAIGFRSVIFFNTQLMKIMGVYAILERKIGSIHLDNDYSKSFQQITKKYLEQVQKIEEEAESHKQLVKSKGISVRIQNLSFNYLPPNGSEIKKNEKIEKINSMFDNFSLQIPAGSVIALVGPSGIGKSTLFNLITKLSDPDSGRIFLDDMPLSLLTFDDIQQTISYVTQQNFLFRGTLEENLSYGNQGFDCSQQNLINCLKLTNAYNFVMNKGGLTMMIEQKGKNLSGGEKQRIIMARALVKNPRLLLLDEATAGVDGDSEQIIIQNLRKSRKDMTTIIITHKIDNFRPLITGIIDLSKHK